MEVQKLQQGAAQTYGKSSLLKPGQGSSPLKDVKGPRGDVAADRTRETGFEQKELKNFSQRLEKFMGTLGVKIKFHIHEDSGELQAEILEAGGEKVIRKVPPDEILNLAASLKEISGLFMNRSL
ncbi:MAG: flagellar protein FlaG [Thermodesulfobacteriota bacterium]|nr:flagellar protein FlaG [Thermodesulfobacteriota bacterium]